MTKKILVAATLLSVLFSLSACSRIYYGAMEKVGVHKRDIFIDRVDDARDAQKDGKEEFKSALEQFQSVVKIEPSKLHRYYKKLNNEYENAAAAAEDIHQRIDDVEDVANALFREWEKEIDSYSNARLKRDSKAKLKATNTNYQKLLELMRASEEKLQPALTVMYDHVLYLKHNLNAQAINTLRTEVKTIDRDVSSLIAAMEKSIAEADSFIAEFKRATP